MKKPLLIMLGLVCMGLSTHFLSAQSIPELLYYKFDGSGTRVPNYASSPPAGTDTATILGSITQGGTGICQGTLIGSGNSSSTDYLNTNWAPNLGAGSWTISFRTSGISNNATLYYIFGDANTNSFRCFTNGVAGPNNWILRGAGLIDVYINGGALSTPTMCTFVFDNTTYNVKGYLDGVLVTTVAQSGINVTGIGPFKVMGYATNVGAPAGGMMDEFRLYNRALSDLEVMELFNPFTGQFLGPDQYTCPGDTSQLDLTLPFSSAAWSTGATGASTFITDSGTYSVSVSGACGSGADTIEVLSLATSSSTTQTSCVSYTAPSGNIYDSTGIYTDTIPNMAGCDSLISIDLTILDATTQSISPSTCGAAYTAPSGAVYAASGTYQDTILNAAGCDSIITINLTINTVNTAVTQSGASGENLSAASATGTFQWINCTTMQPIAGETNSSFTAAGNGSVAVIVTENGCTDTSSCYTIAGIGIEQNTMSEMVRLYPNPTTGTFTVDIGNISETLTIELINSVGQVIRSSVFTHTHTGLMDIENANGLYFVRVTNAAGEKAVLRIVKK